MLKINNLKYTHNSDNDIYNYSLEIYPQEIVAIVGKSGSGKSTLLDLISGFLDPISGSITLNDKELICLPVEKRPLTILFQNNNLFEHLSVQKNISLGTNNKDSYIGNILKEVKLEGFEENIASTLSGGQQQRVALARVLLRQEPILLLDEPFSGLDTDTRVQMLNLVKKITIEHKLHTIMITHNLDDCKHIANKIYTMKNNKLIKS